MCIDCQLMIGDRDDGCKAGMLEGFGVPPTRSLIPSQQWVLAKPLPGILWVSSSPNPAFPHFAFTLSSTISSLHNPQRRESHRLQSQIPTQNVLKQPAGKTPTFFPPFLQPSSQHSLVQLKISNKTSRAITYLTSTPNLRLYTAIQAQRQAFLKVERGSKGT